MAGAADDEEPIDDETFPDWVALVDRAQRFDGYGHVGGTTDKLEDLLLAVRVAWVEGTTRGYSEADLRAALFGECRRNHHQGGYRPSRRLYDYMRELERLADGRSEPEEAAPGPGAITVAGLCDDLGRDPLHQISLGSKELFHSNFLAWMAERDPQQMAAAFDGLGRPGDRGTGPVAAREWQHSDLVLWLPGMAPLLVENKTWSLPDDVQLARLAEGPGKALGRSGTAVLLSLTPPAWEASGPCDMGGLSWRHLSYGELADRLDAVTAESSSGGFEDQLIARYCILLRRLHRLAALSTSLTAADPVVIGDELRSALRAARVHDGVAKARAQTVAAAIVNELRSRRPDLQDASAESARRAGFRRGAGWRFLVSVSSNRVVGLEAGFSNGSPLNSGQVALGNGDRLIWQYQGGQWRLGVAASRHQGRTDHLRAKRHAYIAERYDAWCTGFEAVQGEVGPGRAEPTPVKGGQQYQRFDPDFAFRYCRIDREGPPLTCAQLVSLGSDYIERALDWNLE